MLRMAKQKSRKSLSPWWQIWPAIQAQHFLLTDFSWCERNKTLTSKPVFYYLQQNNVFLNDRAHALALINKRSSRKGFLAPKKDTEKITPFCSWIILSRLLLSRKSDHHPRTTGDLSVEDKATWWRWAGKTQGPWCWVESTDYFRPRTALSWVFLLCEMTNFLIV